MTRRAAHWILCLTAAFNLIPAYVVVASDRWNAFLLTTDGCGQVQHPDLVLVLKVLANTGLVIGLLIVFLVFLANLPAIATLVVSLIVVRIGLAWFWTTVVQQHVKLLYSCSINFPGHDTLFRFEIAHLSAMFLMFSVSLWLALSREPATQSPVR